MRGVNKQKTSDYMGLLSLNMAHYLLLASIVIYVVVVPVAGKPVKRGPPQPRPPETNSPENRPETGLAYDKYLREVVEVLESDPEFRKKLESANVSDIKSGNIAMHLEFVNHTVRTALDELKRREVARLQDLAHLQMQGMSGIDLIMNAMNRDDSVKGLRKFEIPGHLDLKNPHSFEMQDLKQLILKTTADLEELEKQTKEEFKQYEMEKEFEKKEHLQQMSEEGRKKEEARLEGLKKKHADHPKVNHPASKDQFEEVWEKVDHLDQDFDPKTFFFTHDLNGDMEWSVDEVKAVLVLELDKIYDSRNSPDEDDPVEREEEMNRMRRHVFEEIDKDRNFRISLQEYLDYTGVLGDRPNFEKDEGWKTVDEEPAFSEEDYQKFLESHHPQEAHQPSSDLKFESEHAQENQQQQQALEGHQEQQRQQKPKAQEHPGQAHQQHQQPEHPQGGDHGQEPVVQQQQHVQSQPSDTQQQMQERIKELELQLKQQQQQQQEKS